MVRPLQQPENGDGIGVSERDAQERQTRRESFLWEVTARIAASLDPEEVLYETAKAVGEYLGTHRCLYIEIDEQADTLCVRRDFVADGIGSMAGTFPLSAFGAPIVASLRAGNVTESGDIETDPRLREESRAIFRATNFRSFLAVPLHRAGQWVAVLAVHQAEPRAWTVEEAELLTAVTERTWLAVENARLYRAMQDALEQGREQSEFLRRVLQSSPDCIKTLDLDGHVLTMNEGGQAIMEVDDFGAVCGTDWRTFWQDDTRDAMLAAMEAAKAGGMGRFQGFCPTMRGTPRWWDVVVAPITGANGRVEQLLGVSRDITEQREAVQAVLRAEQRQQARLTDIFMRAPAFMATLRGANHVFEMANPRYLRLIGGRDVLGKSVAEALPELAEQGFVALLDRVYQTGEPFVGKDVPAVLQATADAPQAELFIDLTFQPLFDDSGAVGGILVHGVDLTERKRLEQESARLLAEEHARTAREMLLNEIGAAVRGSLDPEAILQSAVSALGRGLGVDRCYFVRYDYVVGRAEVRPEWVREGSGLEPLTGRTFTLAAYPVSTGASYRAGNTHVVNDSEVFAPAIAVPLAALGVRALVRVPIEVGDQMTAIGVGMARMAREWTPDEVRLVENVATLIRSALESAQAQQREHNIAQQLQDALLPPAPPPVPGLALASFYRPALDEAGVGGDFFDVFAVEKGCTALVVADLSGKGLAAASQVAVVRNMLRYAMYNSASIADAATTLNQTLVENDLITGFATLFVGVYDHAERTLTYVNCGQEDGLVLRAATGQVERLEATAPILGGFDAGGFLQKTVRLAEGDLIALFTDGLTEVGATRRAFLEVEGVINILCDCCVSMHPSRDPHEVVASLMAGVDEFGRGGTRDDIALLVGVVGKSPLR